MWGGGMVHLEFWWGFSASFVCVGEVGFGATLHLGVSSSLLLELSVGDIRFWKGVCDATPLCSSTSSRSSSSIGSWVPGEGGEGWGSLVWGLVVSPLGESVSEGESWECWFLEGGSESTHWVSKLFTAGDDSRGRQGLSLHHTSTEQWRSSINTKVKHPKNGHKMLWTNKGNRGNPKEQREKGDKDKTKEKKVNSYVMYIYSHEQNKWKWMKYLRVIRA